MTASASRRRLGSAAARAAEPWLEVREPHAAWTLHDGDHGRFCLQCNVQPARPGHFAVRLTGRFHRDVKTRAHWPQEIEIDVYSVPAHAVRTVSTRPATQAYDANETSWGFAVENVTSSDHEAAWVMHYADRAPPPDKASTGACTFDATFAVLGEPLVLEIRVYEVPRASRWQRLRRARELVEWQPIHVPIVRVPIAATVAGGGGASAMDDDDDVCGATSDASDKVNIDDDDDDDDDYD